MRWARCNCLAGLVYIRILRHARLTPSGNPLCFGTLACASTEAERGWRGDGAQCGLQVSMLTVVLAVSVGALSEGGAPVDTIDHSPSAWVRRQSAS